MDFDTKIEDSIFVYKLYEKRDKFLFFIVRTPLISSNVPATIFYGPIFPEHIRLARCTLTIKYFILRASDVFP